MEVLYWIARMSDTNCMVWMRRKIDIVAFVFCPAVLSRFEFIPVEEETFFNSHFVENKLCEWQSKSSWNSFRNRIFDWRWWVLFGPLPCKRNAKNCHVLLLSFSLMEFLVLSSLGLSHDWNRYVPSSQRARFWLFINRKERRQTESNRDSDRGKQN